MMASLMQGSQDDFTTRLVNTLPHITINDERRLPPKQPAEAVFEAAEFHGLTPEARRPGIKNPLATMASLEAWIPGRRRAIGQGAGHRALCQSRRRHQRDRHRSQPREQGFRSAQTDARRNARRALPRHQRHRARRPAGGENRRPHRRQHHDPNQPRRADQRPGGRLFPLRASANGREHGLCARQDRPDSCATDRAHQ